MKLVVPKIVWPPLSIRGKRVLVARSAVQRSAESPCLTVARCPPRRHSEAGAYEPQPVGPSPPAKRPRLLAYAEGANIGKRPEALEGALQLSPLVENILLFQRLVIRAEVGGNDVKARAGLRMAF